MARSSVRLDRVDFRSCDLGVDLGDLRELVAAIRRGETVEAITLLRHGERFHAIQGQRAVVAARLAGRVRIRATVLDEAPPDEPDTGALDFDAPTDLDEPFVSLDTAQLYLRQISRTPLLTAEQEVQLARRIEAGVLAQERLDRGDYLDERLRRDLALIAGDGRRAFEHMVQANLRFVVSLARKYLASGEPLQDLIQAGNLGLLRAVQQFDFTHGFKFSTFAHWHIRQQINRWLADQGRTIRIPVGKVDELARIWTATGDLRQRLGREPTEAEIAADLGSNPQKVGGLLRAARPPISLQTPLGPDGDDAALGDMLPDRTAAAPDEVAIDSWLAREARNVVRGLPGNEAQVLAMRLGLDGHGPASLEEVGRILGLPRASVRRLESKAIAQLRTSGAAEALRAS